MAASRVDVAARLRSRPRLGALAGAAARRRCSRSRSRPSIVVPAGVRCARPRCSCSGTARRPREAAWRGFLFTVGTFLAGTYWLYHSIHLVGQAPVWVALFLMLGPRRDHGRLHRAASATSVARWAPASGALRWLFLLPALWVLAEWLRGWFLSGFPWLALGYIAARDTARAASRRCSACTA